MRLVTTLILLVGFGFTNAQDYNSYTIDDDLKKYASVVVRKDIGTYNIHDKGSATIHYDYVVTILNSSGKRFAERYINYMQGDEVTNIKATIYNSSGKKVRSLKKSEINDMSAGGSSFFSDARVKIIDMKYHEYPYTMEMSYTKKFGGLLFYENWWFQSSPSASVEESEYIVQVPKSLRLRYKEVNLDQKASVSEEGDKIRYHWKMGGIKAFKPESFVKNPAEQLPRLILGPNEFSMGGYAGNMSSWEGLSTWYYHLNKNRDILPESTKQAIMSMVKDIEDPREKIRIVYEFMQSKTRYVSLQLGIGGWQTLEASHVDELGWGDCKALTNYTKSLLHAVGIQSHEALVRAGANSTPIYEDFPSSQFNHVILSVPLESDTVWLECTSQTDPFNHLGSFTGNRKVLIVKKSGGKLVNSKRYLAEDNVEVSKTTIDIKEDGNALASIERSYSGALFGGNGIDHYRSYSEKDQEQLLYKVLDLANFSLSDFKISRSEDDSQLNLDLEVTLEKYVTQTGKRLFLPLNPFTNEISMPKKDDDRMNDFYLNRSYTELDTIHYSLPKDYYSEYLPDNVSIKKLFGEYRIEVLKTEASIEYVRKLIIYEGEYPAEMFDEYREFIKAIKKHDNVKIVLQKKT